MAGGPIRDYVCAATSNGAVPAGDIVILAAPYSSAAAVLAEYGDALDRKLFLFACFVIGRVLGALFGKKKRRKVAQAPYGLSRRHSGVVKVSQPHKPAAPPRPAVNVNGTPMVGSVNIRGRPFGVTTPKRR